MTMELALDIVKGPAESIIIAPLMRQIHDAIHLDDNRSDLEQHLNRMRGLLRDVSSVFDNQQQSPPESFKNCVQRMEGQVIKGRELIESSRRSHRCLRIDWAFLYNFRRCRQIREWRTNFNGLFDELRTDFSVLCYAQQIAYFTARQAEVQKEFNDLSHAMMRIELKSGFKCEKCKQRFMKCIAGVEGVVYTWANEMKIITVIGSADPVFLVVRLKKIGFLGQLLSVGPAQENKFRRSGSLFQ